jgi:hypothetical protein
MTPSASASGGFRDEDFRQTQVFFNHAWIGVD